jgi:hypothetical protein
VGTREPVAGRRTLGRLAAAALLVFVSAAKPAAVRRVALRLSPGLADSDVERLVLLARRRGVEVQVGIESSAAPREWETLHLAILASSGTALPGLAGFPVTFEAGAFRFDGRLYSGEDCAIFLERPGEPRQAYVLGGSARVVLELAARRFFDGDEERIDYAAVSGELSKTGRFVPRGRELVIDRDADRDGIAGREAFFAALRHEKRGGLEWEYPDAAAVAAARWEKVASSFAGKKPFTVRIFPDAAVKGLYSGSTRPADLSRGPGGIVVEIDASAPAAPDLVSPVLAAAAHAAENPALLERPMLLLADGARRAGRWWGRDVRGFGAFVRAAGIEPEVDEVVASSGELSPVLAVGAAASWLEAGARLEGEAAVGRALSGKADALVGRLERWRDAARRQPVSPPARRPLPEGFLRGVSYAMTNTVEAGYAAPESLRTLERVRGLSANSISVLPYGFVRDPKAAAIAFVHRSPRGETDEGIVRAISDARSLGMTAMVKPQLWLAGGAFVGGIAMADDAAWRSWFAAYRRFVVHHAVVAEAAGAALFCVGTELTASEQRKNDWKETVAAVRLATGAPLLYAANWASGARDVPFWDVLDAVGVDFYDPLARTEKATDRALDEGVRRAAGPLSELARRLGKPVVFTEAGYPAVRAAWISPHDENPGRPAGGEDAARAVRSVYRALAAEEWWKGVYWWKVFSGKKTGASERGFAFLGTPAGRAIAEGFRAPLGVERAAAGASGPGPGSPSR